MSYYLVFPTSYFEFFSSRVIPCVNQKFWSTIQRIPSPSSCSNLEVKKKSPLIGAGELRLKREAISFMSPCTSLVVSQCLCKRSSFFWERCLLFIRRDHFHSSIFIVHYHFPSNRIRVRHTLRLSSYPIWVDMHASPYRKGYGNGH